MRGFARYCEGKSNHGSEPATTARIIIIIILLPQPDFSPRLRGKIIIGVLKGLCRFPIAVILPSFVVVFPSFARSVHGSRHIRSGVEKWWSVVNVMVAQRSVLESLFSAGDNWVLIRRFEVFWRSFYAMIVFLSCVLGGGRYCLGGKGRDVT